MGKGVGGGVFSREAELTMLPNGKLKIFADFFRRIVRRIESINPVSDPDGTIIVEDSDSNKKGRVIKLNAKTIRLKICVNGEPKEYDFYVTEVEET